MTFPLDKILTISAKDYVGSSDVRDSYDVKGVHYSLIITAGEKKIESAVLNFAEMVPGDAEIVVGYKNSTSAAGTGCGFKMYYIQISGTALIPKNK